MRKLIVTLTVISLSTPHVTLAQKILPRTQVQQRRAEKIADRFVDRFQQTLDFGSVWKEFRLSDPSCTHRANGNLSENDYAKLRLNGDIIEKLYVATMNLYYLKAVYELSHTRIDSKSEDVSTPAEIEVIEKRSKFFQNDDRKPQSYEEVSELIGTFDQLARLYRKYLPKEAMKSATWRANEKNLRSRSEIAYAGVLNGDETFCIAKGSNVYIVDRGIFYFYVVAEGDKMKVAGLGID